MLVQGLNMSGGGVALMNSKTIFGVLLVQFVAKLIAMHFSQNRGRRYEALLRRGAWPVVWLEEC